MFENVKNKPPPTPNIMFQPGKGGLEHLVFRIDMEVFGG
jgi:hypothetical protein